MKKFIKHLNKYKDKNVLYALLYIIFSEKYYWYEVRYVYRINGVRQFDWVSKVGLSNKKTALNRREVKKITKPLHLRNGVKSLLKNGDFDVEFMCYLGRFSNDK